jgi:hypothetical protein
VEAIVIELDSPTPDQLTAAWRTVRRYGVNDRQDVISLAKYGTAENPRHLMRAAGTICLTLSCICNCGRNLDPSNKDALGLELCPPCLAEAEMENEHSDGYHDEPVAACPYCRAQTEGAE